MDGGWTRVRHIANAETPIIKLDGKEKAFPIMYLLPAAGLTLVERLRLGQRIQPAQ